MPSTRRSTGGARARPGPAKGGQSTISFSNRITKPIPKETKPTTKAAKTTAVKEPEIAEVTTVTEVAVTDEAPQQETKTKTSPLDLKTEAISDEQISSYWEGIVKQDPAHRVHQQGLTTAEKLLRYFDVSSQYGPCIGISRIRRWQRAEKLGLNPPVEVLAVMCKDERQDNDRDGERERVGMAYIDEIMNPTLTEVS